MPDNAKDHRDHTRAIKDLTSTMKNLVRVCEALNENLVAIGRLTNQNNQENKE